MKKEDFLSIIEKGVQAPSGENLQPWKVVPSSSYNEFTFNLNDTKLFFESGFMGTYLSCGTFLENIAIAATQHGYHTQINYNPHNPLSVGQVTFQKGDIDQEELIQNVSLYNSIDRRSTVRIPYDKTRQFPEEYMESIMPHTTKQEGSPRVILLEGEKRRTAEQMMYEAEKIRYQIRAAHNDLAHNIKISPEEISSGEGLDYRTLGLPVPASLFARVLRSNTFFSAVNRLGIQSIPSYLSTTSLLKSSQGIAALTTPSYEKEDVINAGRTFESFWLHTTSYGGVIQPFAVFPFFKRISEISPEWFSSSQHKTLEELTKQSSTLHDNDEHLALFFRFGLAHAHQPKTLRKPIKSFIFEN